MGTPTKAKRILIGVQVRQDEETFELYIRSLANLVIPEGTTVDYYFIFHNSKNLAKYVNNLPNCSYYYYQDNSTFETSKKTHEWKGENFSAVVLMKNLIIDKVLREKYDYWFLVDSDIILHPMTLKHLYEQKQDMIGCAFVTEWQEGSGNYGYNFWDYQDGSLINPQQYLRKGVYLCGGTGACCLYSAKLLSKIKNVDPIPYVKESIWEDRAVSIKALVHGFNICISTVYPAIHLYRKSILDDFKSGHLNKSMYLFSN